MRRRPSVERRAIGLVAKARLVIGDYGTRPLADLEIERVLEVFSVAYAVGDMEGLPAMLLPPIAGEYRIAIDHFVPRRARRYILLHELAHVLAGEADEPTKMIFTGPLPESEDVCDLFALLGIVPAADIEEGGGWLERRIRELVPLDDRGWQVHRIPRLAGRLPRVREMVSDLYGYY